MLNKTVCYFLWQLNFKKKKKTSKAKPLCVLSALRSFSTQILRTGQLKKIGQRSRLTASVREMRGTFIFINKHN